MLINVLCVYYDGDYKNYFDYEDDEHDEDGVDDYNGHMSERAHVSRHPC